MEQKTETKKKENGWWKSKKTSQKVSFIISIILFTSVLVITILMMDVRKWGGDELGDQIYGEGVANAWVKIGQSMADSGYKWLMTFMTLSISYVLNFIVSFITRLFTMKSRKAKTVSALVRSLTKYVIIIIAIAVILTTWGVDVASIIAGVGVLTLIIGLGCQTLIQDVISGLFIVFDDYFAVGDMVIIDGFRGEVTDIGLKSTKLKDASGNIKSISNSSITTVVDLSREDSIVTVDLYAGYNEDPRRVEAIIQEALPELKKRIPKITDMPVYKGIDSVGDNEVGYMILCHAKEGDRFQVTRDLQRELLLLCLDKKIQIVYPQITVNPADPANCPKPTPEQVKEAEEANWENRKLPVEEEETSFFHKKKIQETLKNVAEDTSKDL